MAASKIAISTVPAPYEIFMLKNHPLARIKDPCVVVFEEEPRLVAELKRRICKPSKQYIFAPASSAKIARDACVSMRSQTGCIVAYFGNEDNSACHTQNSTERLEWPGSSCSTKDLPHILQGADIGPILNKDGPLDSMDKTGLYDSFDSTSQRLGYKMNNLKLPRPGSLAVSNANHQCCRCGRLHFAPSCNDCITTISDNQNIPKKSTPEGRSPQGDRSYNDRMQRNVSQE